MGKLKKADYYKSVSFITDFSNKKGKNFKLEGANPNSILYGLYLKLGKVHDGTPFTIGQPISPRMAKVPGV